MENLRGVDYLRNKLDCKRPRVLLRYKFYEMKNIVRDLGIATPPELRWWMGSLGWCARGVDALADRLSYYRFAEDNFNIGKIYAENNPDVLFDNAILSAMISSCCFLYIAQGADGRPRIEVIDGGNATGVIDEQTGLLREGYAVLARDENGIPITEAYFEPGRTRFHDRNTDITTVITNPCRYPLLVPVVYRPDATRPFGRSRISRACMDIVSGAIRTVKRSEIAAEFYSFPQKYVTGLSQDAEQMDKWRASMSSFMAFTVDDDGNKPTLGQFVTQSQGSHVEQLRMFASLFAGETGLTLDDLGFAADNPSSAEAIKASHETLRLTARKAQKTFGRGFLNAGFLAACLRDDMDYERRAFADTEMEWEPVFEPDSSALGIIGDALIKLNTAVPGFMTEDRIRKLTGIK